MSREPWAIAAIAQPKQCALRYQHLHVRLRKWDLKQTTGIKPTVDDSTRLNNEDSVTILSQSGWEVLLSSSKLSIICQTGKGLGHFNPLQIWNPNKAKSKNKKIESKMNQRQRSTVTYVLRCVKKKYGNRLWVPQLWTSRTAIQDDEGWDSSHLQHVAKTLTNGYGSKLKAWGPQILV